MNNIELMLSRATMSWMCASSFVLFFVIREDNTKFNIGPNPNFFILNVCIDTPAKYASIVIFCFLNSGVRSLNHTILQSWITNTVQNKQFAGVLNSSQSYQISFAASIYIWFDFFMYMNILMAQFDMLLVEVASDLLITLFVTRYFLNENNKKFNNKEEPLLNLIY